MKTAKQPDFQRDDRLFFFLVFVIVLYSMGQKEISGNRNKSEVVVVCEIISSASCLSKYNKFLYITKSITINRGCFIWNVDIPEIGTVSKCKRSDILCLLRKLHIAKCSTRKSVFT